ncbi:MAG: M48 family metallopeptidase [Lachnospiraceae bacterium]|nr:M48 family metallopeptidase [Lachnospiraceae bacterium]
MNYEYTIIRSRRRTFSLCINTDGQIVVKAPLTASEAAIRAFVSSNSAWLDKHMAKVLRERGNLSSVKKLTSEEIQELKERAARYIPKRVAYYSSILGVTYGRITIRTQRSRWGSCTSTGNLNFNALLMLCPPDVIDSVVVHELCHRLEMNHSSRFYYYVYRIFPNYKSCDAWLKQNGRVLLAMLP